MNPIHTEIISDAHAYTRSRVPWRVDGCQGRSVCQRLVHYISGGGMRTFGRTVRQEEVRLRQRRFVAVAAVIVAGWLALLLV